MAINDKVVYDDEVLSIKVKPKVNFGKFQAIGRIGSMYNKKPIRTDIFKRLRTVSKPAFELFDDLKDTRDPYTNLCYLSVKGLSNSQLKMFRSRIKELKDAGILRKAKTVDLRNPIKKGSYMINPELIKCAYDPEGSEATWNLLK